MDQRIDETQHPGRQQQQAVDQAGTAATRAAQQANQCEYQRKSPRQQAASDQPRGEVGPLHLLAGCIGEIAQQRRQEQRGGRGEEYLVQRMQRPWAGAIDNGGHARGRSGGGMQGFSTSEARVQLG